MTVLSKNTSVHNPLAVPAGTLQSLVQPVADVVSRFLLRFAKAVNVVSQKVQKEDIPRSYGLHANMISHARHCSCGGSCATCQHIALDTWVE